MSAQGQQWYVIQTKPKKEPLVVGLLSTAGYDIFLPKMKRVTAVQPLFPRYCFLRADLRAPAIHQCVRFTRGVARILGDQTGPIAVATGVVETIRASTLSGSVVEQELLYHPRDTVMVKAGVLRDLVGIVEKNLSDVGRVRVLFKWLSRKITADIDYRHLEKVA